VGRLNSPARRLSLRFVVFLGDVVIDWGSVPDWLSGVGGIGALVAAIVAVVYTRKAFRLQRDQVAQLTVDSRRQQAAKIAVWMERDGDGVSRALLAFNGSDAPVYRAAVKCANPAMPSLFWDASTVFPPGEYRRDLDPSSERWAIELVFMDGSNTFWKRSPDGELQEISGEEHREFVSQIPAEKRHGV
jgi:hypothetical protein